MPENLDNEALLALAFAPVDSTVDAVVAGVTARREATSAGIFHTSRFAQDVENDAQEVAEMGSRGDTTEAPVEGDTEADMIDTVDMVDEESEADADADADDATTPGRRQLHGHYMDAMLDVVTAMWPAKASSPNTQLRPRTEIATAVGITEKMVGSCYRWLRGKGLVSFTSQNRTLAERGKREMLATVKKAVEKHAEKRTNK